MSKRTNHFVNHSVWTFGKPNKNRIPALIEVNPKKPNLPKYVQMRKLKSGDIAYYWCPPFGLGKMDLRFKTKTLGRNWEHVLRMSKQYNLRLAQWRKKRKQKL